MTWRKRIFLNLIPICLVLGSVSVAILTLSRRELLHLYGLVLLESVIAVIIGTIIGTYVMALGAHTIVTLISPLRDSDWIWGIRIGTTALIILVLSWLGQRVTKKQH